ncbi:MAG: ATP-dependent helicase HrpB, partial [Putridiphycobacter sp.]|nr:ATP-dependent helicase HrpB [Putridiphycobacter sp.]
HQLYGKLPYAAQQAAILPSKRGLRKIVLATDIAETSLTIEGITTVVDSGFHRKAVFNPKTGLSGLETKKISKDSADQRAGRAGRLSPGVCYRLWSTSQHSQLKDHRAPEILTNDLIPLTLELANWGISDVNSLTWLNTPPSFAIEEATNTLEALNAIAHGKITNHGKAMHALPCHPRIAHLLLVAKDEDSVGLACDLAAILEERDPLPQETGIDINLRIEALRRQRSTNTLHGDFKKIEKISKQYRQLLHVRVENASFDPYDTGLLLVHAFPERIAFARPGNNAQFQLANGTYAVAGHKDDLAYEPWLAVAHMHTGEKTGRIFLAAPLNPTDLKPFVKTIDNNTWHTKRGGLIATRETRIGSIVLKTVPLPSPDEAQLVQAICKAIAKEGAHLLDFSEDVQQWQNRVLTLKKLNPNQKWPDVSTDTLLKTNYHWLSPYLQKIVKPEDLKKIDLAEILQYSLSADHQNLLSELAPKTITVPTGSKIKLKYQSNGSAPVLAVRLQEVFGMTETPKINNQKTAIILHLLSPGYKLVQITSDLDSFWKKAYFDVRKDLRARYKKHAWPENPLDHPAIRGTKRQNGIK